MFLFSGCSLLKCTFSKYLEIELTGFSIHFLIKFSSFNKYSMFSSPKLLTIIIFWSLPIVVKLLLLLFPFTTSLLCASCNCAFSNINCSTCFSNSFLFITSLSSSVSSLEIVFFSIIIGLTEHFFLCLHLPTADLYSLPQFSHL
jgi:hypothetical protein